MQRVHVDSAAAVVKECLRSLPLTSGGVELELEGEILCKVVPRSRLGNEERKRLLTDVRKSLAKSRSRNRAVAPAALRSEIDRAVEHVRRRKSSR